MLIDYCKNKYNTCSFVVVDIDSLQLEVGVTVVGPGWVNAVLIRDHLPKLKTKC